MRKIFISMQTPQWKFELNSYWVRQKPNSSIIFLENFDTDTVDS